MNMEREFEAFLGIDSEVTYEVGKGIYQGRARTDLYCYPYEPTPYKALKELFDQLPLTSQECIVDFGCGKGRVLFYCNQRFFCKVKGIEFDKELYRQLLDNAEYYHVRFHGQRKKVQLFQMDARWYHIQSEDTVFYFFNPFTKEIFDGIIDAIEESVEQHPRRIYVMLYYAQDEYLTYLKESGWQLHCMMKLPGYEYDTDEKAYVFTAPLSLV